MTFIERQINVTFTLADGNFGSGGNTVKVTGLRASATIERGGGIYGAAANLRIWGLPPDIWGKLITLGTAPARIKRNQVLIEAGDADSGISAVFNGDILYSWLAPQMPDAPLIVAAQDVSGQRVTPIAPTSFKGAADVATILAGIAVQAGLRFENNGVSAPLSNQYLEGSPATQIAKCAEAANINYQIADGVLAIWPKTGARGGAIPLLSKDTGLIGYPAVTQNGLSLKSLFLRGVIVGGQVKVQSDMVQANGVWPINSITHMLDAQMPNGQWFTTMEAFLNGQPQPV
jgi:hypothetical protein